jgi:hypothetical protein
MLIRSERLSVFFLIAVPFLLIFQGIDFTDTGWVLANYQQIFSDPSSVSYWFHLWLPNVIGGAWNVLFGGGGLISFKIAALLIFWLTAFLVYRGYKDTVPREDLCHALLLGMVLHFPGKITVIHYNNISTFFLILGCVLLLRGIKRKKRLSLFFSGAAASLAVFARIPNVLGFSLVFVLVYAWFLEKGRAADLVKDIAAFAAGIAAAAAAVIALMLPLGHFSLYRGAVADLFFGAGEDLSHYGSNTMEKKFFLDWGRAFFSGAVMIGFIYGARHICRKYIRGKHGKFVSRCGAAALALAVFFVTWREAWSESMVIVYPFTGFTALSCLAVMIFPDHRYKRQKPPALAALLLTVTLSTGSDTGMKVAAYGLIFGFPLALWFWRAPPDTGIALSSYEGNKLTGKSALDLSARRGVMACIMAVYTAYALPFTLRNVYRDSSARWRMTSPADHPMLRGIRTTPERAAAITSLLKELDRHVKPGDPLLTYESIPMVHFLAKTRPYLYNPWPILYLPGEFKKNLDKARTEREELPPAVLAKVETRSSRWPASGDVNSSETAKINRETLYAFLEASGYIKVWENEAFVILLPAVKSPPLLKQD